MGAGRKTSTYTYDTLNPANTFEQTQRNLGDSLGGVIFGCSNETYLECVQDLVFGLPKAHWSYVQYITPGMPIFLFNYSTRQLHGTFKALSDGELEIKPHGWSHLPTQRTKYPAQVRVEVSEARCAPLPEKQFRPILKNSYYEDPTDRSTRLCFELRKSEAQALCRAFEAQTGRSGGQQRSGWHSSGIVQSAGSQDRASFESSKDAQPSGSLDHPSEEDRQNGWELVESHKKKERAAQGSWAAKLASSAKQPPAAPAAQAPSSPSKQRPQPHTQLPPPPPPLAARSRRPSTSAGQAGPAEPAGAGAGGSGSSAPAHELLANGSCEAAASKGRAPPAAGALASSVAGSSSSGGVQPEAPSADVPVPEQLHQPALEAPVTQAAALELAQLMDALQALPPRASDAIVRHVQHSNEAIQQALLGQRRLAAALEEAQAQALQLQAHSVSLQECQTALMDEVVALRQGLAGVAQAVGLSSPRAEHALLAPDLPVEPHPFQQMLLRADLASTHTSKGGHQQLFLLGGNDGSGWLDAVEIFTPATGAWASAVPMLLSRGYGAAAALGRNVYIVGGGVNSSWMDTGLVCKLGEGGHWLEIASMSCARGSLAAVGLQGQLWAVGGGQPGLYLDSTEVYDPASDAWHPGPLLNERRYMTAATAADGCIYAAGGYNGSSYLRSMERLDPREGTWQIVAEMQQTRSSHALTVGLGQVWAVGGWDGSAFLDSTEIYDARSNTWRHLAAMSKARAYGAAVTVNETVYALGGMLDDVQHNELVEQYDAASNSWQPLAGHSGLKRTFLATAVVDVA